VDLKELQPSSSLGMGACSITAERNAGVSYESILPALGNEIVLTTLENEIF
jgi:hypothetical protein